MPSLIGTGSTLKAIDFAIPDIREQCDEVVLLSKNAKGLPSRRC